VASKWRARRIIKASSIAVCGVGWYLQAVVAGGVERVVAQGLGAQPPEGVEPVVDGDDLPHSS
jgi:hypothetical protein